MSGSRAWPLTAVRRAHVRTIAGFGAFDDDEPPRLCVTPRLLIDGSCAIEGICAISAGEVGIPTDVAYWTTSAKLARTWPPRPPTRSLLNEPPLLSPSPKPTARRTAYQPRASQPGLLLPSAASTTARHSPAGRKSLHGVSAPAVGEAAADVCGALASFICRLSRTCCCCHPLSNAETLGPVVS